MYCMNIKDNRMNKEERDALRNIRAMNKELSSITNGTTLYDEREELMLIKRDKKRIKDLNREMKRKGNLII